MNNPDHTEDLKNLREKLANEIDFISAKKFKLHDLLDGFNTDKDTAEGNFLIEHDLKRLAYLINDAKTDIDAKHNLLKSLDVIAEELNELAGKIL